jgi:hypothetical protein
MSMKSLVRFLENPIEEVVSEAITEAEASGWELVQMEVAGKGVWLRFSRSAFAVPLENLAGLSSEFREVSPGTPTVSSTGRPRSLLP